MSDSLTWYAPWTTQDHAVQFDFRTQLDDRNAVRLYETLNDVRLLKEYLKQDGSKTLLEVGCATGDFYRYLTLQFPDVRYYGVDVSIPAILRAQAKYPEAHFLALEPGSSLTLAAQNSWGWEKADIVFAADVMHHQIQPLSFLSELLPLASQAVILRCRTRDVGRTQWDPQRSRQLHYGGWVPYIVLNLQELMEHIRSAAPECELVIYRNRVILGGRQGRQLPPECALKETGTAETSIGIFLKTDRPGRVTLQDRVDNRPHTTWDHKWRSVCRRFLKAPHGF